MTGPVCHPCDPELTHLILSQTGKILQSSQFNGSELLRNLLSYLAKRAVEHPGEGVKEYELAVDVLGAPLVSTRAWTPRFVCIPRGCEPSWPNTICPPARGTPWFWRSPKAPI